MLQFMSVESVGKKVLLVRGYLGMSLTLVLLTITLYLQVSQHKTRLCSQHISEYFDAINMTSGATKVPLKLLFPQTHISWVPYCSMVLVFFFIFFFASGPGTFFLLQILAIYPFSVFPL